MDDALDIENYEILSLAFRERIISSQSSFVMT